MGLPPPQAGSSPSPGGASPPLTENTVDKCPLTHRTIQLHQSSNVTNVDQQTQHLECVPLQK